MDFEVFSVSQIKEHADAGEDPKRSVVSGLLTSGRSIAAAATIMGFWFGSFVLNGDPTVKPFGIGLALAVILDARAVRCLLVPARTASLGKANWYLPRWLGQILPRISIECEKYIKPAIGSPPRSSSKPSRSRRRGRSRRPHRRDDCPS
jgi:RND superfamily putative drug exporter